LVGFLTNKPNFMPMELAYEITTTRDSGNPGGGGPKPILLL